MYKIALLLWKLVEIALFSWIFIWSAQLSKTSPCAGGRKLLFIQAYVVFYFITLLMPLMKEISTPVYLLSLPMNLAFVIVSMSYLKDLDRTHCATRNDTEAKVLAGVAWMTVAQWVLAAVLMLAAPLTLAQAAGGRRASPLVLTSFARLVKT